jgi:hypothetical protein
MAKITGQQLQQIPVKRAHPDLEQAKMPSTSIPACAILMEQKIPPDPKPQPHQTLPVHPPDGIKQENRLHGRFEQRLQTISATNAS